MSMDLNGINNQNEYYTNHYFASVFEDNAQDTLKRWREQATASGERTPWQKINLISKAYYAIREQSARFRGNEQVKPYVDRLLSELLPALDYPYNESSEKWIELEEGVTVPVSLEMTKANGAPLMWIVPVNDTDPDLDILECGPCSDCSKENESLASSILFDQDEPPRWVLFVGLHEMALIDRNKWNEKRFLEFDLDEIFSRKEETTLQAMAVLLHRESICPKDGTSLLDQLDDNSHKHASEVSVDLKYALRECIELLGNEVIRDMRERQHVGVFGKELANDLTLQCLRYMYRILFMLFIEAKPELGYAPMKAMAYASGYSFDSLRDIAESAHGESDMAMDGTYLKDSLDLLFKLIYNGYPEKRSDEPEESLQGVFRIEPLKAHIFDPERTALIERAKLRNSVVIKIIDLMSMTRNRKGQRRGRGRISYSNLGINQLGSVYEALLSYRGFFAEEDLYEVKRKGDKVDDLDVGYFITEAELSQYDEDERVRVDENDPTSALRVHEKGKFIYRLAGREREKSASYYTPEVLTKCLVKYALKELLEGKTADQILELTVCEPAMGSAAFLNEATTQLAEAYLSAKEKELGKTVPHDERVRELQKIKMYIADRNVYGIDLNPVAVELAEVSLWLNSIYEGGYVPWFRTQINNGNSLIGARRQCYHKNQLTAEKGALVWYNNAPERIEPGQKRKFGTQIYHFLVGDPGMCNYTDKVIKELEPEKIEKIKKWNKEFCKPLKEDEIDRLLELSATIDKLWDEHVQIRWEIGEKTTDPLSVWGQPEDITHRPMTIREKDRIYDNLYLSAHQQNAGPYARLKAAMDYWCALWFWPIDKADELPTRQQYIFDMYALLGVNIVNASAKKHQVVGQIGMFDDEFYDDMYSRFDTLGEVNLDQLRMLFPWLKTADEIANGKLLNVTKDSAGLLHENREGGQHFFHWELEFADVFQERGGFDLVVGNPPWIKIEWNEVSVLGDWEPLFPVKKIKAPDINMMKRKEVLARKNNTDLYFNEYETILGELSFLNAIANYPLLKGQQTNLFRCFLPQAWEFCNSLGISAFVHPNGVYDDPRAAILREKLYRKLRYRFQFQNEKKLFEDVLHLVTFSLNIYSNDEHYGFDSICNLYIPETIDECYDESITGDVPLIKDINGDWNTHGHPDRVVRVTQTELRIFAKFFDGTTEWRSARLPILHAKQLVEVIDKFARANKTLDDIGDDCYSAVMWDEVNAQNAGIILRDVHFAESPIDLIYSGSHIGVANPFYKTSRRICDKKSDFDSIDLTNISDSYLPRCNYLPKDVSNYYSHAATTPWGTNFVDEYKIISRRMLNQVGERTLIASIAPAGSGYIVFGMALKTGLAAFAGCEASLPFDFYIKVTGKSDGKKDTIGKLPYLLDDNRINKITVRSLLLNCITEHYGSLWKSEYKSVFPLDHWSKIDSRLSNDRFSKLKQDWSCSIPLRSDYERRQALVELDVLVAMALKMSLKQLKTIYRIQFPTLQNNEKDTWYDAKGRIVFTPNTALSGVGFDRSSFEKPSVMTPIVQGSASWNGIMKDAPAGYVFERTVMDDTQPNGPMERTIRYYAPFDRCDREMDYETAWEFFSRTNI